MQPSIPSWFLDSSVVQFFGVVGLAVLVIVAILFAIADIEIKTNSNLDDWIGWAVDFFAHDSAKNHQQS